MRKLVAVGVALFVLMLSHVAAQDPGPWPPPGVYLLGRDPVVAPKAVSNPGPRYTQEAIRAKVQGVVTLQAVILADGTVGEVRVAKAMGYGLDEAAIATAKQWRFTPGAKDGLAVPVAITLQLGFNLAGVPPPMTLPDGFAEAADSSSMITLHDDSVDEAGVTIHFAYPDRWTVNKQSVVPALAAALDSQSHTRLAAITRSATLPAPFERPVPAGKLELFTDLLSRQLRMPNGGPPSNPVGVGQSPLGASHWIWVEADMGSVENPAMTPEVAALAQQMFSGGRVWAFTTGSGTKAVTVICTALTQRGRSAADLQAERRQAIAEFTAMLKRTWIEQR